MFNTAFLLHLTATAAMILLHVLGYNVVFGRAKILHFGPITSSMVAAYVTFLLLRHTGSWAIGISCGLLATAVLALLFAGLSRRLPADAFGVLSIALQLAAMTIIMNWTSVTRGALGISGIPRLPGLQSNTAFTIAVVCIAFAWIGGLLLLDRSASGRALRAMAEHDWFGQALGISALRIHSMAFLLAGLGAFLGNFFYHQYIYLVHPRDFDFQVLIFFVMIVVAGKPGSVLGVATSTLALVFLKEAIRFLPIESHIEGPLQLIIFGMILLGAVWYRRDTLFPARRSV